MAILLLLFPAYLGPYVYVFTMSQSRVFAPSQAIDQKAFDSVTMQVDTVLTTLEIATLSASSIGQSTTFTQVSYSTRFEVLNRIFNDYQRFPALVDVSKLTFSGTGIFNGTILFQCSTYVDRLPIPTGSEALLLYKSKLQAGNNTVSQGSCRGAGLPAFDLIKLSRDYLGSLPIILTWTIQATMTGKILTEDKVWQGTQNTRVILPY